MAANPQAIVQAVFGAMMNSNKLKFSQDIELVEVLTQCEMNNKYKVVDDNGNVLLKIKEKTSFCTRQCCGQCRPIKEVNFFAIDPQNSETKVLVMQGKRDCACTCCCAVIKNNFSFERVDPMMNTSDVLMDAKQKCNVCYPNYSIVMGDGKSGRLYSPKCMCIDFFFPRKRKFVLEIEDCQIPITHLFKLKNIISDADSFMIEMPSGVKQDRARFERLILASLASAFTLDISYYESSGDQNRGLYGAFVQ